MPFLRAFCCRLSEVALGGSVVGTLKQGSPRGGRLLACGRKAGTQKEGPVPVSGRKSLGALGCPHECACMSLFGVFFPHCLKMRENSEQASKSERLLLFSICQ